MSLFPFYPFLSPQGKVLKRGKGKGKKGIGSCGHYNDYLIHPRAHFNEERNRLWLWGLGTTFKVYLRVFFPFQKAGVLTFPEVYRPKTGKRRQTLNLGT